MSTFIASLAAGAEDVALRLAAAIGEEARLAHLATNVAELEPNIWQVVVYLEDGPSESVLRALNQATITVLGRSANTFVVEKLPKTDWVKASLESLPPIRAGRLVIHGSHDRGERRPNDVAIEIEAGEAFGTGHHGTTVGCLLEIDALARSSRIRNALDIGTGSGVLAIAIARLMHIPVLATDIDPVAVGVARANARANGANRLIRTVVAGGLAGRVFDVAGPFDMIVANILAAPLISLSPAIRRRLNRGGTLVLSGLLPNQRARIVAAYRRQGLRLIRDRIRDGWLTMVFRL